MAAIYSVTNWSERFEVAQSRKVDGPLSWVALPCKHDGLGFRRIMLMEDGPEIYGAWVLIVQVAAKCPKRGVLADENGPLDASDLALKTGCREGVFSRALKVLSSKKIAWIMVDDWEPSGIVLPTQDSTEQDSTEQTRQDTVPNGSGSVPSPIDEFVSAWNASPGTVRVRDMTEKRTKLLRTRLKNSTWAAAWPEALKKFPLRCFANDPNGWQPNIDWFLRPDAVTWILEGKYDWEKQSENQKAKAPGIPKLTQGAGA